MGQSNGRHVSDNHAPCFEATLVGLNHHYLAALIDLPHRHFEHHPAAQLLRNPVGHHLSTAVEPLGEPGLMQDLDASASPGTARGALALSILAARSPS
jgi:hypothetical protein